MDLNKITTDLGTALGQTLNPIGTDPLTQQTFTGVGKLGNKDCFESVVSDINGNKTVFVFVVISSFYPHNSIQGIVRAMDQSIYKLYPICKDNSYKFFILVRDGKSTNLSDNAYIFVEIADNLSQYQLNNTKTFQVNKKYVSDAVTEQRTLTYEPGNYEYYVAYVPAKDASGAATTEILKQYLFSYDSRPNSKYVIKRVLTNIQNYNPAPVTNPANWPQNFIIAGAPGTGKSYKLNQEASAKAYKIRRVTFYEDYSYESFVGCYKPEPKQVVNNYNLNVNTAGAGNGYSVGGSTSTEQVTYKYVPGPFMQTYVEAMNDSENIYILIIEEINRAKAASVFGDVFQLLDRGTNGVSTYSITAEPDLANYLQSVGLPDVMRIPGNMYIWATMNNADQGVFPLDSAFKRRWGYLYLDIDSSVNNSHTDIQVGTNLKVKWDKFRRKLNEEILQVTDGAEDKCIGAWYFSDTEFDQIDTYFKEQTPTKRESMVNPLCDKLLSYLRNDVFRYDPTSLFDRNYANMPAIRLAIREDVTSGGNGLEDIFKWDKTVWNWIKK